jgi:hypothetical protein
LNDECKVMAIAHMTLWNNYNVATCTKLISWE